VRQAGSWRPNDAQPGWIIENRAALHPNRNLDFTFVDFHLLVRDLVDPAWLVPSEKLAEVCTATGSARNRGPRWLFTADRSGLARDRAAKYQVAVRELAAARRWSILPPKAVVAGVSANSIETGTFFERHFETAFLEAASGHEVLMAAGPDNFGRHRRAFSKESGRWRRLPSMDRRPPTPRT
jgi:hypothetical protein